MTAPSNPKDFFTPFLPTTFNIPEEEDRLKTFLNENFANISDVVNDKMIGAFTQSTEAVNGSKWSYDTTKKTRAGYQALARVIAYPDTGVLVIPNPIPAVNQQLIITQVYGSASMPMTPGVPGSGVYFTFAPMGDPRVSFVLTDTTITITTTVDLSAYTGFIIISYIRDGI